MHVLLFVLAADLMILQKGSASLGFYSADGKPLGTVAVTAHPHEMVRVGDLVFTTDNGTMKIEQAGVGGNKISIIDVKTRKKAGEISLGNFRRPHGIDYHAGTGRIAVTTELPDQLILIDVKSRAIVKTLPTGGTTSHMVVFSRDGKTAFVSNSTSKSITVIDIATGKIKSLPCGDRPEGSVLSPDGSTVWVANREAAQIVAVDTAKQEVRAVVPTGKGPVRLAVTPDGKTVVVALIHDKAVEFVDVASKKVTGRVAVEGNPVSLTLSADGKRAYASSEDINLVHVIDVASRKVTRTLKLGDVHPDPVFELNE